MWVWRDEMTPESNGGDWRPDAYAGQQEVRVPGSRERVVSRGGDRAIAAIGAPPAEYTPIFHAMTDRWAGARVPEPHPGSGPLPVQDGYAPGGLAPVPTVPPPTAEAVSSSAEEELRRRAERRRRPRAVETAPTASGRHTLLPRDEPREGRHVLRR